MATLLTADGVAVDVPRSATTAAATLAHVTQDCGARCAIPVPFPAATVRRVLDDGALAHADQAQLIDALRLADYLAWDDAVQRTGARVAATDLTACDMPLELWAAVAPHLTLDACCAVVGAQPHLAGVLRDALDDLWGTRELVEACAQGRLAVCRMLTDEHTSGVAEHRRDDDDDVTSRVLTQHHMDNMQRVVRANNNFALSTAAAGGHLAVVRWLVEEFGLTAADARDNQDGALVASAEHGHLPVVRYLAERFYTAERAPAAFDAAVRTGHMPVVTYLADWFGVHAGDVTCGTHTMLQLATESGHMDVVLYMAERFNMHPCASSLSWTAANGHLAMLQYLVERRGMSAPHERHHVLMHMVMLGGAAVVRYIVERLGVTAEELDDGCLPDLCAVGDVDAVRYIVETFGMTAQDARSDDNAALVVAASRGHMDVVRYLVDTFGLTPKDARSQNNNALRKAASNGHAEMVRYLVDTFGLTAKDAATQLGFGCWNCLGCAHLGPQHLAAARCYVEALQPECSPGSVGEALVNAAECGNLPAWEWLTTTFAAQRDAVRKAGVWCNYAPFDADSARRVIDYFGLTAADVLEQRMLGKAAHTNRLGTMRYLVERFQLAEADVRAQLGAACHYPTVHKWLRRRYSVGARHRL